ncbi:MAG: leucine-rich repeat domain-containing protein [Christensenellales bacterium]
MKRGVLAAVLCGLTLFACAAQAEISGQYTYQIEENGTVSITDFSWKEDQKDIYIPDILGGYRVTDIGEKAFARMADDHSDETINVVVPNGIKSIGEKAFMNAPVSGVSIPASVQQIGDGAFANCPISQFILESENAMYATIDGVLYNKMTKTLVAWPREKREGSVPEGIVEIGNYAVYGDTQIQGWIDQGWIDLIIDQGWIDLTTFIPSTVEKIGNYAFAKNKAKVSAYYDIKAASFGENVREIGEGAFQHCVLQVTDPMGRNDMIIGDGAFEDAIFHDLNNNIWEGTVKAKKIGDRAFAYSFLYNATLDDEIIEIGESAFVCNTNRMRILITTNSKLEKIGKGAFQYGEELGYQYGSVLPNDGETFVTPRKVKDLSDYSFSHAFRKEDDRETGVNFTPCRKIEVSEGTERIGNYTFEKNVLIESVTLPSTLTEIGVGAFQECPALTSISIPSSVKKIGDGAFDRATITLEVEQNSYAALWASENGYKYRYQGVTEDTSWLNP